MDNIPGDITTQQLHSSSNSATLFWLLVLKVYLFSVTYFPPTNNYYLLSLVLRPPAVITITATWPAQSLRPRMELRSSQVRQVQPLLSAVTGPTMELEAPRLWPRSSDPRPLLEVGSATVTWRALPSVRALATPSPPSPTGRRWPAPLRQRETHKGGDEPLASN